MAATLAPVDAVLVGFGWTGAIMAQQLCDAGLSVLALERGPWRDTATDFAPGFAQDELRYMYRHHLFQNVAYDTLTVRNNVGQEALPMRHLGSFLPGTGVGSGGVHWNGQIWRFLPSDFVARSHNEQRYGRKAVTDHDLTVQDWGITYDELEPCYDEFDKLCGTSGKAGKLNGSIMPGGNPFEGSRSSEYPTPPMAQTYAPLLFGQAAAGLGHHPFPHPSGNLSQPYVNPLGAQLGACTYCGFCEKFGCGNYSKASPQTTVLPYLMRKPNFTLKTECEVLKVELTADRKRATGVTYVNSAGEEFFQPAEMVILSAYILQNVRLLLLSGIGEPYDPGTRRRGGGQELRVPDDVVGERVLRRQDPQPVHRRGRPRDRDRRLQRRQLRPFGPRLHRRRLRRRHGHRRAADRDDLHARGYAGVGPGMEACGGEELPALVRHQLPWRVHEPPRQLPRSRPHVPRRAMAGRCCA